jgi:hypothetical protein
LVREAYGERTLRLVEKLPTVQSVNSVLKDEAGSRARRQGNAEMAALLGGT